jgi:hypothetical protein
MKEIELTNRKPDPDGFIRYEVNGTKVVIFPPLSKEELNSDEVQAQLARRRSGKRTP